MSRTARDRVKGELTVRVVVLILREMGQGQTMLRLDHTSPDYYEKKLKSPLALTFFRILQIICCATVIAAAHLWPSLMWFPDKVVKKFDRRGFIVHYGEYSEVHLRGALYKKPNRSKKEDRK